MTARSGRIVAAIVLGALALFAVRDLGRLGPSAPWRTLDDFPDFYCAGEAIDRGASPYTYEPLRTCEHRVNAGAGFRGQLFAANPAIAIPAPQPPYDIAAFGLLARAPFGVARGIAITTIALAAVAFAVTLLALAVPAGAAVALAFAALYSNLATGQIAIFALLAAALCGLALARRREGIAGALAACTAIEPTLGVALIAAVMIFVPRARLTASVGVAALIALSFATTGVHGTLVYLGAVLPAHAATEIHFPFQYSLTYALAFLGVPARVAQFAGFLSYVVAVSFGLWIGARTARVYGRRELIVFVPALACVVGGGFVHSEELIFALPALAVLSAASSGASRALYAASAAVLAVPWVAVWGEKQLFLASALGCIVLFASLRVPLRFALVAVAGILATIYGFELHPPYLPQPAPGSLHPYAPGDLVQREWHDYAELRSSRDLPWMAIKFPVWLALLAALFTSARAGYDVPAKDANGAASTSRRI